MSTLTHQKICDFFAQLYSWDFESKNDDETEVQDEEEIEIIIEEDEDSEVVKPKKNRKSPQIHDSDDEDVEEDYSEVIRPKVKRKPPLIAVCNFQSMKSPVKLNSFFLKLFCYITWFD